MLTKDLHPGVKDVDLEVAVLGMALDLQNHSQSPASGRQRLDAAVPADLSIACRSVKLREDCDWLGHPLV